MTADLIELRLNEISDRIRAMRERGDLTLVQLSERSGVAPSTIQKIENRQMTPSIAIILKMAAGLGIEAADLIAPADPSRLDLIIQRAGQHARILGPKKAVFEKLSADLADTMVECWRVYMGARQYTAVDPPQKLLEQIFVCESGRLELELDHQTYVLDAGDTLHFRSKTLYGVRNLIGSPSQYLFTGRYPHGFHVSSASSRAQAARDLVPT